MEFVKLIEPDGTENVIVEINSAIEYCNTHVGWSWRYLTPEEKENV